MLSRLRFWFKRGKNCPHCCVICRFYDLCRTEMETDSVRFSKDFSYKQKEAFYGTDR